MKKLQAAAAVGAKSSAATAKLLIFFIFLIAVFWAVNMYRHIKKGKWSAFQKVADIGGLIFFGILLIIMIKPLI